MGLYAGIRECLGIYVQEAKGLDNPGRASGSACWCILGSSGKLQPLGQSPPAVKDFKFVPLMFVPLSFGSQIPLLRAIFHGLGTQTPRVQTLRVQRKTP